jgi:hypothetical protein
MTNNTPQKLAIGLAAGYCLLVFLAHLPTILSPSDALNGIAVVLLTLPWSMIMVFVLDLIDPTLLDDPKAGFIGCLIGAVINAVLVYLGVFWVARSIIKSKR